MNTKVSIAVGFLGGVLVCVVIPLIVLAMGWIYIGADVKPTFVERSLGHWAVDRSVAARAAENMIVPQNEPKDIAQGLDHYKENCLICHSAPGMKPSEIAVGLNPPAPLFWKRADDMSDGELFWIVKHGIRMTPMPAFGPTHDDRAIGQIVAFVRHLPHLSEGEIEALGGEKSSTLHQ